MKTNFSMKLLGDYQRVISENIEACFQEREINSECFAASFGKFTKCRIVTFANKNSSKLLIQLRLHVFDNTLTLINQSECSTNSLI